MKSSWTVFRWELRRVLTNWRQAITIFVVPSAILLLILYLFPLLMDFVSTGSIGRPTLYLVDPPASFSHFMETDRGNFSYGFAQLSQAEFDSGITDGSARSLAERGSAFVVFSSAKKSTGSQDPTVSFESALTRYYSLSKTDTDADSIATISVLVDPDNIKSGLTASLFAEEVLPKYNDFLLSTIGQEYLMAGGGPQFSTNIFNPISELMLHRSVANSTASHVLPAALFLLLYYCIYSISFDTVGAERERGFLAKVTLTPIRKTDIIIGKAMAVTLIGLLNSMTIILVFVVASWTNFQNNPFSLIPFGFTPFPWQIVSIILIIASASTVMSLYCFIVIFSCNRPQDVILNLQFPLLLFLAYFFINMVRFTDSLPFEAFIPIHGAMTTMRDVLLNSASTTQVLTVVAVHAVISVILLLICRNMFQSSYSYNEIEERK